MLTLRTSLIRNISIRRYCTKPNKFKSPIFVLNAPIALTLVPTTMCCVHDPSISTLLLSSTIFAMGSTVITSACLQGIDKFIKCDFKMIYMIVVGLLFMIALYSFFIYCILLIIIMKMYYIMWN